MTQPLAFGILGTGNIARQFAAGLRGAERSRVVAVGSRSEAAARTFAGDFDLDLAHAHATYEDVLADPAVEAVYIALPNAMHYQWTLNALDAGKHVLCEKPLAATRAEAETMFERAEAKGLMLVEAFMYMSHPQTRQVLQAVGAGAIGDLRMVRSSFCIHARTVEGNVRFDPAMAGGALMDLGCYCLSFARLTVGEEPGDSHIAAALHETGVDAYAAGTLTFPSGPLATFAFGLSVQGENRAIVQGTEGYIEMNWPWKPQGRVQYTLASMTPPRQDRDGGANPSTAGPARPNPGGATHHTVEADRPLYALEADDFAAAVRDGTPPAVSRSHSIGNAALLEKFRREMGVR